MEKRRRKVGSKDNEEEKTALMTNRFKEANLYFQIFKGAQA